MTGIQLPLSYNVEAFPSELASITDPHTRSGRLILAALSQAWQRGYLVGSDSEEDYVNPYVHACQAPECARSDAPRPAVEGTQVCAEHRERYLALLGERPA